MTDDDKKSPGGRPRLAPGEGRTERSAHIRLTITERAQIEAKAAAVGLSVAEYSRRRLCDYRLPAPRKSVVPVGLLSELNRVGNNLNQIAHAANAGRALPAMAEQTLAELRGLMDLIASRLDDEDG